MLSITASVLTCGDSGVSSEYAAMMLVRYRPSMFSIVMFAMISFPDAWSVFTIASSDATICMSTPSLFASLFNEFDADSCACRILIVTDDARNARPSAMSGSNPKASATSSMPSTSPVARLVRPRTVASSRLFNEPSWVMVIIHSFTSCCLWW